MICKNMGFYGILIFLWEIWDLGKLIIPNFARGNSSLCRNPRSRLYNHASATTLLFTKLTCKNLNVSVENVTCYFIFIIITLKSTMLLFTKLTCNYSILGIVYVERVTCNFIFTIITITSSMLLYLSK